MQISSASLSRLLGPVLTSVYIGKVVEPCHTPDEALATIPALCHVRSDRDHQYRQSARKRSNHITRHFEQSRKRQNARKGEAIEIWRFRLWIKGRQVLVVRPYTTLASLQCTGRGSHLSQNEPCNRLNVMPSPNPTHTTWEPRCNLEPSPTAS